MRLHRRPTILIDIELFYDNLFAFLKPLATDLLFVVDQAIEQLQTFSTE